MCFSWYFRCARLHKPSAVGLQCRLCTLRYVWLVSHEALMHSAFPLTANGRVVNRHIDRRLASFDRTHSLLSAHSEGISLCDGYEALFTRRSDASAHSSWFRPHASSLSITKGSRGDGRELKSRNSDSHHGVRGTGSKDIFSLTFLSEGSGSVERSLF